MRERKVNNRVIRVQGTPGRNNVYALNTMTSVGEDKIKNISFSVGWFVN